MIIRSARPLLVSLFAFTCLITAAFGQGSKMKSPYDLIEEGDKDRPDKRAEWNMRGRVAPGGESAAALRLRAYQQKMALRAGRAAAVARAGTAGLAAATSTSWVSLGPAPLVSDGNFYGMVSGRATSVAIDPSDSTGNTVYLGAAYGGVWKSINAANSIVANVTWTPVTDQQASLATGAISIQPVTSNPVVLVGTGEPNNAIDSYYGVGILRSADGGTSWNLIFYANGGSLPFAGLGVAKFAWSTANTNTVVAATATTAKGFDEGKITPSTNRGLYLSTDAGQSWTYQAPKDSTTTVDPISATDVVYNAAAGKFFAAVRFHGVYSSTDGTNWTRLTTQPSTVLTLTNCPTSPYSINCPMYRGQFAVVNSTIPPRNEMYFWFIDGNLQDQGIWQSLDGGTTWNQMPGKCMLDPDSTNPPCGMRQPFYNMELGTVPNGTATDLYAGLVNLFKCRVNSGTHSCATIDSNHPNNWINLTQVYTCPTISGVHPDEHGLDFKIVGGKDIMYFANDGGIYRTLDGFTKLNSGTCGNANGFDNLNGTIGATTQFVSFSVHPSDQKTVLGGTQDNGSPATSNATVSAQWFTANGGDGGYNAINPTNTSQWFAANTDVSIQVCNTAPGCSSVIFGSPIIDNTTVGGDHGEFYTPYILDPQDSSEVLVGTCRVWRGSTTGTAFSKLSVDFDTLSGTSVCTGNEVNLVRGLAAGGPKDTNGFSNVVYAATEGTGPNAGSSTSGGEVWATTNADTTLMANVTPNNPSHYTISSVALDTSDTTGQTAFVGFMGFGGSHVFKTTTAGSGNWTDWTGNLPDAPVNALLVDPQGLNGPQLYAGTDVGVFVSTTTGPGGSWAEVGPKAQPGATGYLPNVAVSAIRMFSSGGTKKLRVSTYGRGIWEFALALAPDFTNVISDSPKTVFPTQNAVFHGTLAAQNGYNAAINLSCSGTPPATCILNPTQVPAPGNGTYTVTAGGAVGDYNFNAHAVGTDANTTTHDAPVTLHVVDFGLTAPNPNALTVAQGGTSNQSTFQVTASGSFSQSVTLSCPSGLPTGAACSFSPSSTVSPTASSPVTVTLTVSTGTNTPLGGPTTITISATTSGAPAPKTQTFTLTVVAPDFSWAGGGSHQMLSGQTTPNYTFTATPSGATFVSDVNLSCTNLPALTACIFNPSSVIAAGTVGAQTIQLTITSTGPNSGPGTLNRRASNRNLWLPLTLPLAGVVLVGVTRRKLSRQCAIGALCVCLMLAALLVACGGGGSGPPPPPISVTVALKPGQPASIFPNNQADGWPAQTAQFMATVNNSSNQAVTWSVSGGAANGTIDSNGVYTSPTVAAGLPATATIIATAQADGTTHGQANETLNPATLPGTYNNITVTATDSQISRSQTVTLTVK